MRIGVIIGRIGDVDGVALETEKWIQILQDMGHEIYILSGRFHKSIVGEDKETLIPALSFFSPECEWEQNRSFFLPPDDPSELIDHLHRISDNLAIRMFTWIMQNKLEILLSENASALPAHLTMGMAINKLVETTGIPIVCHDHDYWWERGDRYKTPFPEVERIVTDTFPMQIPHAKHAVINTYCRDLLKTKFGISSIYVPNVMDFDQPYGKLDDYNRDLPEAIGLKDSDIPLFQITRIVKRKGIETALDLIHRLDDENIKLVITGSAADDNRKGYYKELIDIIHDRKLKKQVVFASHRILNDRKTLPDGKKIYSLSDAYAHATATTYFSTYEGFGNAFVESVLGRTPIFVNNYKPVFWPDIGSKGFNNVMIENSTLTDKTVTEIDTIIRDKNRQQEIAEHNFNLGKLLFSYDVLREKMELLFG